MLKKVRHEDCFVDIAKSLGGEEIEGRSKEQLEVTLEAVKDRKGPYLIELRLEPLHVPRIRTLHVVALNKSWPSANGSLQEIKP